MKVWYIHYLSHLLVFLVIFVRACASFFVLLVISFKIKFSYVCLFESQSYGLFLVFLVSLFFFFCKLMLLH